MVGDRGSRPLVDYFKCVSGSDYQASCWRGRVMVIFADLHQLLPWVVDQQLYFDSLLLLDSQVSNLSRRLLGDSAAIKHHPPSSEMLNCCQSGHFTIIEL